LSLLGPDGAGFVGRGFNRDIRAAKLKGGFSPRITLPKTSKLLFAATLLLQLRRQFLSFSLQLFS
jgi:hypothetical protein